MSVVSAFVIIPCMLLFAIGVPVLIGVYVYRDAKRRNMDAVLWTLIAVLVPSLIGFIIYLVVRSKYSAAQCPDCGAWVEQGFARCPNCGKSLKNLCPGCGKPVEHTWKVCPACGAQLPENMEPIARETTAGKLPVWLLVAVIALPLLLVLIMALVAFLGIA